MKLATFFIFLSIPIISVSAVWPQFLNNILPPFADFFRYLGFPMVDRPQIYDVPNQPCTDANGNTGSDCTIIGYDKNRPEFYDVPNKPCTDGSGNTVSDCTIIGYDTTEYPASVYPMNFNRPDKQKPFVPSTQIHEWPQLQTITPNNIPQDVNDNCQQEIPMLVVKPLSQRYIIMSDTVHFMGAQRFYKKTNEMFIRRPDESIRETLEEYLKKISSGNVENIPPPVIFKPLFEAGGGNVISPGLVVGPRQAP